MSAEAAFVYHQGIKFFLLFLIQCGCGLLAVYKGVKVNYTRKIVHFSIFLIPIYLDRVFAYKGTLNLFVAGSLLSIAILLIYIKPIRERIFLVGLMFASIDRPEDRPHSLLWLATQVFAGFMVIIPMGLLFAANDLQHLLLIPIWINAIGDGLAEPVGVRFGRHTYSANALFTNRKYHRTLEGSACVYFASLAIIAAHHVHFTLPQLTVALVVVPVVMTLAEAFSPHTWDTPLLLFAGYAVVFGIAMI